MFVTNKTITIHANSTKVFFLLENLEEQKKWMIGLENIEYLDKENINFNIFLKEGNKVNMYKGKTLQYKQNELLEVVMHNDYFQATAKYYLEPNSSNTILHYTSTVTFNTVFYKIMWFLLGKLVSGFVLNKMLKKLKALAEQY